MAWKIFEDLKEGKLGSVETVVTFDKTGAMNLSVALFVAGLLILLAWYAITKKL